MHDELKRNTQHITPSAYSSAFSIRTRSSGRISRSSQSITAVVVLFVPPAAFAAAAATTKYAIIPAVLVMTTIVVCVGFSTALENRSMGGSVSATRLSYCSAELLPLNVFSEADVCHGIASSLRGLVSLLHESVSVRCQRRQILHSTILFLWYIDWLLSRRCHFQDHLSRLTQQSSSLLQDAAGLLHS